MAIVPESLSPRDTAIVMLLAKEKVVQRVQEMYIRDMKAKDSQLQQLNQKLQKKVLVEPKFVSTKEAANFLNVDPSFLTKRQGTVFKQNEHYFKPPGESIVRWDIEKLEKWMRTTIQDSVDEELEELLQRS